MTKVQKAEIDAIKGEILKNDDFAIKCLLVVYANQTSFERGLGATVEDNGVGFSGADAEFGTSLCEQYNRKGRLSERQMPYVKKIAKKYGTQIYNAGIRAEVVG